MAYPPQGVAMQNVLTVVESTQVAAESALVAAESALAALQVPDPDGDSNDTINQLIGNRNDSNSTHTIFGHVHDIWEGSHHEQKVWPALADAILVTAHADAWTLGNYAEIVAANAISEEFHIHHIQIISPSANGEYELVLYTETTEILRVTFSRTDKKDDVEGLEIVSPHCDANAQIQMKVASGNAASADSIKVKLWYHLHE